MEFVVIVLMLILNAFFAAYEMALASVSRVRLAALVNDKKKGADDASYMKDRMEASLTVIQLGITLCGAIAAATGGASVAHSWAPSIQRYLGLSESFSILVSLVLFILPLSFLTMMAELIPKVFAINNKEWVCLKLSPLMRNVSRIIYPVVQISERTVKWFSRLGKKHLNKSVGLEDRHHDLNEIRAAANVARASRVIGTREEKIVLSAAHLSLRPVKSIMLHARDISMLSIHCTLSEALIRAHMDMHTRFPVCEKENDVQSIIGYVNFKDIVVALKLNPSDPTIKGITRPIKTVNQNAPLAQGLEQMMQEKLHIALVRDDDLKIVGMITLEDIIEELVGEIEDEFDYLPAYIHSYGNGWLMGGGVSMSAVCQTAGVIWNAAPSETPTLAEWALKHLGGRLPKGGELIEGNGLSIVVRKLRRNKLAEAIVNVTKE